MRDLQARTEIERRESGQGQRIGLSELYARRLHRAIAVARSGQP